MLIGEFRRDVDQLVCSGLHSVDACLAHDVFSVVVASDR
jgi:hypothetical protein